MYPFETQNCNIQIFYDLVGNADIGIEPGKLVIEKMSRVGDTIGGYTIANWSMVSVVDGKF